MRYSEILDKAQKDLGDISELISTKLDNQLDVRHMEEANTKIKVNTEISGLSL